MADLKLVYKADTEDLALTALDDLEEKWEKNTLLLSDPGEITGLNYPHILNIHLRYVN